MQGQTGSSRGWILAITAVVLAALVLRWRAFSPFDISHADELMQYLEQARRLATGQGIVPWEYRYGARNGGIAQILSVPWLLGERFAPGTLGAMLLARWSFVLLTLLALPAAWKLGALTGRAQALIALLVAAVWYESVLFSTLLLSEVLATGLIACALPLLLADERRAGALRWAGLLLGLGVVVRLQFAPFAAVVALLTLRTDWKAWGQLVLGGLGAAVIGGLSDLAMGRWPFEWVWVNFSYNIGESRAARFGENGPFDYLTWLAVHLGPGAPLILAAALAVPARYRPVLWALAANIVFHSLITHKEYRFIWLSTFLLLVMAAIGSVGLLERLRAARGTKVGPAQLVLLGAGWIVLSVTAEQMSGGAGAMRGGGPIPRVVQDHVRAGSACGIALPDQWRAHLVPALLPRQAPLYIAPEGVVARGERLPRDLAAAANTLVFEDRPVGAGDYVQVKCESNGPVKACLYVRQGACTPAPQWSYQSALEREDL